MVLLDFWSDREANLRGIEAQLNSAGVRDICNVLFANKSSYIPAFRRQEAGFILSCRIAFC